MMWKGRCAIGSAWDIRLELTRKAKHMRRAHMINLESNQVVESGLSKSKRNSHLPSTNQVSYMQCVIIII